MCRLGSRLLVASLLLAASPAVAAVPAVDSISASAVPQGGRIEIEGSGFGLPPGRQQGARVEIGGVAAATSRWADDRITAYASEGIAAGAATMRVINDDGASNQVPITIAPAPAATGDVAWTFVGDGAWVNHRPAIGPDGTLYLNDTHGYVYAIAPDGIVRWIRHGPTVGGHGDYWVGEGNQGPVAVGADGTVYVGIDLLGPDSQLHAYAPDGTLRWIHSESTRNISQGPTVGPDGNVYFGFHGQEGGLRILAPDGSVLHARHDRPLISSKTDFFGAEIAFGPSTSGGAIDRFYLATANPPEGQNGYGGLHAVELDSDLLWSVDGGTATNVNGQQQHAPVAAANGTVFLAARFMGESYGVHAFDVDGDRLWKHVPSPSHVITEVADGGTAIYVISNLDNLIALDATRGSRLWDRDLLGKFERGPVVHPSGEFLVAAGNLEDDRAVLLSVDSSGSAGWEVELPSPLDLAVRPSSRVRFTETGERAYLTATLGTNDGHWALYAVNTPAMEESGSGGAGGTAGTGGTGGTGNHVDGSANSNSGSGCSAASSTGGSAFTLLFALGSFAVRRRLAPQSHEG